MSLRSMTGQGRAEASAGGVKLAVELRAVNHRQFEARLDLPPGLAGLEDALRARLQAAVSRGALTCRLHLDQAAAGRAAGIRIDERLAAEAAFRLRRAGRRLRLRDDLALSDLLRVPGVAGVASPDPEPAVADRLALRCLDRALRAFQSMRATEGRALERDLRARLGAVRRLLSAIAARAPSVVAGHRRALRERLRKAGVPLARNDDRLVRELVMFADRSDISEELTRVRSHLGQARGLLARPGPVGRTLDFLLQELFREFNTIGSKANDAAIAGRVVSAKTELERIREQVQNVE